MSTYYVPPRPGVAAVTHRAVEPPALSAGGAPHGAATYHVPGRAPRPRWVNPIRRAQLARRYPHAVGEVLDLLAMYPEEAADPITLELLAALEPGRTVAQLLRCRYPSAIPGPAAERAVRLIWRRPARPVEPTEGDDDLPF